MGLSWDCSRDAPKSAKNGNGNDVKQDIRSKIDFGAMLGRFFKDFGIMLGDFLELFRHKKNVLRSNRARAATRKTSHPEAKLREKTHHGEASAASEASGASWSFGQTMRSNRARAATHKREHFKRTKRTALPVPCRVRFYLENCPQQKKKEIENSVLSKQL